MSKIVHKKLVDKIVAAGHVPRHIGFIMDGNGRWARKRAMPRLYGHSSGVTSVRDMIEAGNDIGVKVMTFYTFSKENWKRPEQEVNGLMKLLVSTIRKNVDDLDKNNVSLRTMGNLDDLPEIPKREFALAKERLKNNDGLIMNLAISYGSRQEITQAVNRLIAEGHKEITEEMICKELETNSLPDPDLIIRTSGEHRISNFMLWQSAYSEFYITPTFWPDFRREELYKAIIDYQNRERRFGKISEQLVGY